MHDHNRTPPERFLCLADLKGRGWTDGLIKRLLGQPDKLKRNPVFRSKLPMKLYDPGRVLPLENSDEFQDVLKRVGERKKAARRAVETKTVRVKMDLARITIRVPGLGRDRLITRACQHYNARADDRGDLYNIANASCDQEFLDRIAVNYLRHCLTDYERQLCRFVGRVGQAEAYQKIKCKVLDAIARAYPWLAAECERQMENRQGCI